MPPPWQDSLHVRKEICALDNSCRYAFPEYCEGSKVRTLVDLLPVEAMALRHFEVKKTHPLNV